VALRLLLHISAFRRLFLRRFAPKGIYEYVIARTKYIDAVFRQALAEGVDQVLIFGAGFDTRALRFQDECGDAGIFELDVPITQQAKLGQYRKRGLRIPENLVFIPIDFDRESLEERLAEEGFVRGARSLFVMEGLLMYLQPESVTATLKVIQAFAGEGGLVVFDYVKASVLGHTGAVHGEDDILRSVTRAGERWQFAIEEGELEAFLETYGFRVREHLDAHALEQRYFRSASGKIVGRVNGTHCLVTAVKGHSL